MKNFLIMSSKRIGLFVLVGILAVGSVVVTTGVVGAARPVFEWSYGGTAFESGSPFNDSVDKDIVIELDGGSGFTGSALYSDSGCTTQVNNATAVRLVTLRGSRSVSLSEGSGSNQVSVSSTAITIHDSDNDGSSDTNSLTDGTYRVTVGGSWYYKDSDNSDQCTRGSSDAVSFIIDTVDPEVDEDPEFSVRNPSGESDRAKTGDRITTTVSFSEAIDEKYSIFEYTVGFGQGFAFDFTTNSSISSGECRQTDSRNYTYTCVYDVVVGDIGLFQFNVHTLRDFAGNAVSLTDVNTEGVMVDTEVPTIVGNDIVFYETYSSSFLNDPVDSGSVLKQGDVVYTRVTFSEDMLYVTGSGARAKPRILYTIGTRAAFQFVVVNASATLRSGQCKPNDGTETREYVCMYTVGSNDSGEFRVEVGAVGSVDLAGNPVGEGNADDIISVDHLVLDTRAPSAPTHLDLVPESDLGQSDSDNLTSETYGLEIRGCAEDGSVVTLYRGSTEIAGNITADAFAAVNDFTCSGANVGIFTASIDLDEGSHLITAKATDAAEHVSRSSSTLRIVVDATAPDFASAKVTNLTKTETTLMFSEEVFAATSPDVGDFTISDDGSIDTVSVVSVSLATGSDSPEEMVTLTHDELSLSGFVSVSYIQSSDPEKIIIDKAGNRVASDTIDVEAQGSLTIELDSGSDSGEEDDDSISNFDGPNVSFVVTSTSGRFVRGRINVYMIDEDGDRAELGGQSVSSGARNVTVQAAKSRLSRGRNRAEGITIVAAFTPHGGSAEAPSEPIVVFYDTEAPSLEEVVAVPEISNNTTPVYTFSTDEAGSVRYEGNCTSDTDRVEIGDNTVEFNRLAEGVYNNCRIYVTDVAGNESSPRPVSRFEIDTTAPVISSAVLTRLDGTEAVIVLSENVYAPVALSVGDFYIEDRSGIVRYASGIDGLESSAEDVDDSFILTFDDVNDEFDTSGRVSFTYDKSNDLIMDRAGNELDYISARSMDVAPFVRLTLDARDDTGTDRNDGITNFGDDNRASFIASITSDSFAEGDEVAVYYVEDYEDEEAPIDTHTVTASQNGSRQITFDIPENEFDAGTAFTLAAALTRADSDDEGGIGESLEITYDDEEPEVEVSALTDEPATEKEVSASDDESGETSWRYTKADGTESCESAVARGASYDEFDIITLTSSDNGKKVCFSSEDVAGNVGYGESSVVVGIDNELPIVSSVSLSGDRDFLKVAMSEPVYAYTLPDAGSFRLSKSGLTVDRIEGLQYSSGSAVEEFEIHFTGEVTASDNLRLTYVRSTSSNKHILDRAGNALRGFSNIAVAQPPSVVLDLVAADDTGTEDDDDITMFDGPEATFVVSTGSSAVFSDGDEIAIKGGDDFDTSFAVIRVGEDVVDAGGASSFETVIAVSNFVEGENVIAAVHRPDGATEDGPLGEQLTITYDSTAPSLTEETPVAEMTNDTTPEYVFTSDEAGSVRYAGACSSAVTAAVADDNGRVNTIIFNTLIDGLYDDCEIYVTDVAGNESDALEVSDFTIDTVAPVVTVISPDADVSGSKMVAASDNDESATEWMYKIVGRSSSCTASAMNSGTEEYTEGESIDLVDEDDNKRKVCFSSADGAGNTGYASSDVIDGIDVTPPVITIKNPTDAHEFQKIVSATDADSTPTTWAYKVLSSSVELCNEAGMTAGTTVSYTEGVDLPPFTSESDNGKRVCFSSTDEAENTSYAESSVIANIDATAPTVTSALTTDVSRSRTKVTLSEEVYVNSTPNASDFRIVVDGTEYPVNTVSDLSRSVSDARSSFVITHASINRGSSVTLKYTKGTVAITDRAGNYLESFSGFAVTDTQFVAVSLHIDDDTGVSQTDGITRFDGNSVTLAMTLTEGTFTNGDVIRVYNGNSILGTYTISGVLAGAVDRAGHASFEISVSKRLFAEGRVTVLHTTYTPVGGSEGGHGAEFSITYDGLLPNITVTNPSSDFTNRKVVSATDSESNETVWKFRKIEDTESCDSETMSVDAEEYIEGEEIVFASDNDNGKKVCFSSMDVAGNTDYEASNAVVSIDTVAPTISSATITNLSRTSTDVFFSEKVYASDVPAASDFTVVIGNTVYPVSTISGLSSTVSDAGTQMTVTHPPVSEGVSVVLHYNRASGAITDQAGNMLGNLIRQGIAISNVPFAVVSLASHEDTGSDNSDSVTKFDDGGDVDFVVTLSSGTFSNGDRVEVFRKNGSVGSILRGVTVGSGSSSHYVRAQGQNNFVMSFAKNLFDEGAIMLYAVHTPVGGTASNRGAEYSMVYDSTAPTVTVENPNTNTARTKVVSASDDESDETSWMYKVVDGDESCSEDMMRSGTASYTEGEDLPVFDSEDDNGMKVCFMVTDLAGNTAYITSDVIEGIDSVAPTIASAVVLDLNRTRTEVTFSEPVYASSSSFSVGNFKVLANNVPYPVASIENVPVAVADATDTLVFVHPSVGDRATIGLSYAQSGQHRILDAVGNELENFNRFSVSTTSFITLNLDSVDDTGASQTDGITMFDGNEASIAVTLTAGSIFSEGDTVVFYTKSGQSSVANIVKRVSISSLLRDGVRAVGLSEFIVELPVSVFPENIGTLLSAVHIPVGMTGSPRGPEILIVHDTDAPDVTVIESDTSDSVARRVLSADDSDSGVTAWTYKQVISGAVCDADTMASDTTKYSEGDDIILTSEEDNGTLICFSVTDLAGNASYKDSSVISGIDTTDPEASSAVVTSEDEITVTMSEDVYSASGPHVDDFVVYVDGTAIYTTEIVGIPRTVRSADDSFVIAVDESFEAGSEVELSYIGSSRDRDNELIRDVVGRTLASFERMPATSQKAVYLTLDAEDDSGADDEDGYTNLGEDSDVSFTAVLSDDTFSDRDVVHVYRDGEGRTLKSVTVGIRRGQVDASGQSSLTFTIPKRQFTEGTFTLSASYDPYRGDIGQGLTRSEITITYDADAPDITVADEGDNTISASDSESDETTWAYKQVSSDQTCNAAIMASGAETYAEGEGLTFDSEEDNDTKVCFSSADTAGNTSYEESMIVSGIDVVAPVVSSMAVTSDDEIAVTMSEPVYSSSGPDVNDFTVYVGDTEMYVNTVQGLPHTAASADREFVLVVSEAFEIGDSAVAVSYLGNSGNIEGEYVKDVAGRNLGSFDRISVTSRGILHLSLGTEDDTGVSNTDAHTNFGDDSDVSFMVTLGGDSSFRNGDVVRVYRRNRGFALETITVSGVRIRNQQSYDFTVPKSKLAEEDKISLYASYTPYRGKAGEVLTSLPVTITHDNVAPTVSVAQDGYVLSASDTDTDTDWMYKELASDQVCGKEVMTTGTETYTEGEELTFDSKEDAGKKVCFSSADTAGNTGYGESAVFTDVVAPIITVTGPSEEPSETKVVSAVDADVAEMTWAYKKIASSQTCGKEAMSEDTTSYTEGAELTFVSEKDFGKKICFSSTDAAGNTGYGESATITDAIAPTISVTAGVLNRFNAQGVKAVDDDVSAATVWTYRQVSGTVLCGAEVMGTETSSYKEDTRLVFDSEKDNGTKVCFSSKDASGNTAYASSAILIGIDTTPPVIKVAEPTVNENGEREIQATGSDDVIVWGQAKIAEDTPCALGTVQISSFVPYIPGSSVVLDGEEDAGKKVCFAAIDAAGNTAFASSVSVSDIDYVPPSISITTPSVRVAQPEETPVPGEEPVVRDEPGRVKFISATDSDASATRWMYKQVAEDIMCGADVMLSGVVNYIEGEEIEFTSQSDNGTKICFAVYDESDNVQYAASEVIRGIDAVAPTVVSAVITGVDRNRTEVTLTESVYAETLPSPRDFAIVIDGASYPVTSISGLARSVEEASDKFVITHPSVGTEVVVSLAYAFGSHRITDVVGNTLESFEGHTIVDTHSVRLSLEETNEDGMVVFNRDGNADLVLTLTNGSFSNGDVVRLYERGEVDSFRTILISNGIVGAVDADGESSFVISLPSERFSEEETVLYAVYTSVGSETGERGHDLMVMRDLTGPAITVNPMQTGLAQSKVIRATDDDDSGTVWEYRMISGETVCDADLMTSAKTRSYEEGSKLVFSKERANGYRACFSSTDGAGNTTYAASEAITGIDSTAPAITVSGSNDDPASSKVVFATDNSRDTMIWVYRQISEEVACGTEAMASGTKSYEEGRKLTFDSESDNGTRVCFAVTDSAGNTSYVVSNVFENIDTVAPQITVDHPSSGTSASKTVRASDTDSASETVWRYKAIKEDRVCDEQQMRTRTASYQEGSGLVFRNERANGYKICFSSSDAAGNASYAESLTMRGISSSAGRNLFGGASKSQEQSGSTDDSSDDSANSGSDDGERSDSPDTPASSPVTSLINSEFSLIVAR